MIEQAGRTLRLALFTAVAVVATALTPGAPAAGGTAARSACGVRQRPPATFAHVIWIWMENHSYQQIIGSREAPYLNTLAHQCGLATNYHAVTHPSLPNYIAATSGGTWGINDDNGPSSHPLAVTNIFNQAASSGSYEESMPSPCAQTSTGDYAVKHNPEAYYTTIRARCTTDDVPLGTISSGAFRTALEADSLPRFSFVTPNLCDDMHDCSVATGDNWLAAWLPQITASAAYRAGGTVVFITWDEDDGSKSNHVATIVVSPYTKHGTRSALPFTHYSLLRTTEDLLGIKHRLGLARDALSMRAAFGL